ncbi:MAG TPA: CDP-diacylglycerol--glycerol-3-phosphate 3-phosphatidyltransferase [Candidatus Avimonoglobus intestinipullorum]|uniref:CDP-diacylglycerol--glycerol-3-phosphate 3-phosphatidyltransferase n=1 Tax=Candidatus Avimonoglobus intestinipullorum TaxID=2840699 RepID=A0A9D1S7D4_9FIRM|nr:CDP-diacylglycerol--glycerol-3-phosphate 3-phosphatidyltransferase [Candidatus Avimonoglobus intestinipullorum]
MTTANKITILRMILVPVFMAFLLVDSVACRNVALVVFILAAVSDAVDGYIARHYNQISTFGKFMDPLADKMLTTAAFVVFLAYGRMSPWALMIILFREFMVSGIRLLAVSEGKVIAASMLGKIKTVSQMVAIIAAIILMQPIFPPVAAKMTTHTLIWISTVFTIISGLDYLIKNRHIFSAKQQVEEE